MFLVTKMYTLMALLILSLSSCWQSSDHEGADVKKTGAASDVKLEDCDEEVAEKTMEKLKAEEFSLMNSQDTGCTTEKEQKPIELPTAAPAKGQK